MGVGACAGYIRAGLVGVLLLLLLSLPGYSQSDQDSAPEQSPAASASLDPQDLSLKELNEIKKSDCTRHYSNPLNLLFLLPGMLFFLFALVTRRYKNILPFFFLVLLMASSAQDPYISIREAERSFQAGRYAEAVEFYRQAEQTLSCNPAIRYNLGILSHYLGEQGYAIHYLRQSLREKPGDPQVRGVLQILEQGYGLVGQVVAPFPVHPDLAYLLLLLFANAALIMAAFVVRTKRVQFLIFFVLLTIAALGSFAFFAGRLHSESRPVGVVISEGSNLNRIPEEDSNSWFELPSGTSLWIRGQFGEYYLVETPSDIMGWVRTDSILID
jgi:tetratricopeptide (TPR) repeat protein